MGCGDGGLPRRDADLGKATNHVACSIQARNGGFLVFVDEQCAIFVSFRSKGGGKPRRYYIYFLRFAISSSVVPVVINSYNKA